MGSMSDLVHARKVIDKVKRSAINLIESTEKEVDVVRVLSEGCSELVSRKVCSRLGAELESVAVDVKLGVALDELAELDAVSGLSSECHQLVVIETKDAVVILLHDHDGAHDGSVGGKEDKVLALDGDDGVHGGRCETQKLWRVMG